jgi:hypothetical protein
MVKILTFPKRQVASDNTQSVEDAPDFLVFDSEDTLPFSGPDSEDVGKTLICSNTSRDWTNQELASIYRVKHLLDAAQVPTELERGVSDEGDPWCVFCNVDADVFIHLSRIDGLYWLDSPKLPSPLNGFSFDALVQGFISLSEPGKQLSEDSQKIIRLQKNNSVFLHPSVMLAALVWSLYFGSDELLIPNSQGGREGADEAHEPKPWLDRLQSMQEQETPGQDELASIASEKPFLTDANASEEHKAVNATSSGFPFGMTLGLASIAVASGLIQESQWKNVVQSLFPSDEASGLDGEGDLPETDSSISSLVIESLKFVASFVAVVDRQETAALSEADPSEIDIGTENAEWLLKLVEMANANKQGLEAKAGTIEEKSESSPEIAVSDLPEYAVLEGENNALEEVELNADIYGEFAQSDVILELMDYFFGGGPLNTIAMDGVVYLVDMPSQASNEGSIELVEQVIIDTDDDRDEFASPASPDHNEPVWKPADVLPLFDQNAQQFIFSLFSTSDSMKFILSGNELIFFDSDIYESQSDRVKMSWTTDDGGTVSLLGAKADLLEYDFA